MFNLQITSGLLPRNRRGCLGEFADGYQQIHVCLCDKAPEFSVQALGIRADPKLLPVER